MPDKAKYYCSVARFVRAADERWEARVFITYTVHMFVHGGSAVLRALLSAVRQRLDNKLDKPWVNSTNS